MFPSISENYLPALNETLRTVDSMTCPATAALESLISKQTGSPCTRQPCHSTSPTSRKNTSPSFNFDSHHNHNMEKANLAFPLIQWYAGDDGGDSDERDAAARCLAKTLSDHVQTTDAQTTDNNKMKSSSSSLTAGKRSRSSSGLMSKTRLVRSIALNSHLSLLEASIQPLEDARTVSEGSWSSTNSLSQKFDVEKWLEVADHNEASEIFASPRKMRKTLHRQESLNTSMYGLALVT